MVTFYSCRICDADMDSPADVCFCGACDYEKIEVDEDDVTDRLEWHEELGHNDARDEPTEE